MTQPAAGQSPPQESLSPVAPEHGKQSRAADDTRLCRQSSDLQKNSHRQVRSIVRPRSPSNKSGTANVGVEAAAAQPKRGTEAQPELKEGSWAVAGEGEWSLVKPVRAIRTFLLQWEAVRPYCLQALHLLPLKSGITHSERRDAAGINQLVCSVESQGPLS